MPSPTAEKRPQHALFRFTHATLCGHELRLGYALCGGPDPDVAFEERLVLPEELPAPDPSDPAVRALVDGCHRAFGTSYFKAAIPARIEAEPVGDADADFWDTLYSEGLGEFYFRNGLSPRGRARFPRGETPCPADGTPMRPDHTLVLIGGGKDSALVADMVRQAGLPAEALSMGDAYWTRRSAEASHLALHGIRRTLAKALFEMNARGAWNGHVPISTCIAFVSTLVAYSAGFANVLVGNERGAEEQNLEFDGLAINHQWSKTLRFEKAFREWCERHFRQGPSYFSLLRPMSEIHIARCFAGLPEQLPNFTSCNVNFRQTPGIPGHRWCGRCPKCLFVYLLLSPHLGEAQTREVFGHDFLAGEDNLPVLEALLGIRDVKPWECVGTLQECRLSYTALFRQGRLPEAVRALADRHPGLLVEDFDGQWQAEFSLSDHHCLSPLWMERLHAYLGTHR